MFESLSKIVFGLNITNKIHSYNYFSGPFYKDTSFIKVRKRKVTREVDKAQSITEIGLESDANDPDW